MAKNNNLLRNLYLIFALGCVYVPALAGQIQVQPTTTYSLVGGNPPQKYSDLGSLVSNINQAAQKNFDNCTSAETYSCTLITISGTEPAAVYGDLRINGEPIMYTLNREGFYEFRREDGTSGSGSSGPTGQLGASVSHTCPSGFGGITEGAPSNERSMHCVQVEKESDECTGNPINVGTGEKFEYEVDYSTADGILKIERRYVNQTTGWTIESPNRLVMLSPGEEAPTNGIYSGTLLCPNVFVEVRNHYDEENIESPYTLIQHTEISCPPLINKLADPVVYVWIGGSRLRFVKSGGVWQGDGVKGLKNRIEELDPSTNNGAAWKYLTSNGDISYFLTDGTLQRSEYISGGSMDYTFGPQGLATKTDHSGRSLGYQYDSYGRLVVITLPDGNSVNYEYGTEEDDIEFWLLQKVTWPDGGTISYLYAEPAHLSGGASYNSPLPLTGKLDANENRIGTYKYNFGKAVSTEGALGTEKKTVSGSHTTFVYVTDGLNTQRSYNFQQLPDGTKLQTRINQPAGSGCAASYTSTQYYTNGLKKSHIDFNRGKTIFGYDQTRGLETARVEGLGQYNYTDYLPSGTTLPADARKTSTQWHPDMPRTTGRAEPGVITSYIYHGDIEPFDSNQLADCGPFPTTETKPFLCRMVQQATTDTNGAQGFAATLDTSVPTRHWLYTYNTHGQRLSESRVPGSTPEYQFEYYDTTTADWTLGDLKRITNALGHQTTFDAYDRNGYPLTITDVNGVQTQLSYDTRSRLTSQSTAGVTTTHSYDLNGNRTASTLPNGITVSYEYDLAKRLTAIEDSAGNRIEYEWDAEGNRTHEHIKDSSDTLAYTRKHIYDALSRVKQIVDGNGNDIDLFYDPNGNLTDVTNAREYTTSNDYNLLNNPTVTTDAENGQTHYTYDGQNRITSVTDANGNTTSYTYDGLGNLTQLSSPDTGVTTFTYDGRGNTLTRTDANNVVTQYQYDVLDRLTNVIYPASSSENVTYTYDDNTSGNFGIGRLTGISDASGNMHFRYNNLGLLEVKTYDIAGQSYSLQYSYDAGGRLEEITYPSGRTVTYGYDSLGQINSVTTQKAGGTTQTIVTNAGYRPFGPLSSLAYSNGVSQTFSYDLDYRITNISATGPYTVIDRAYNYDPNSNIDEITDNLATVTELFTYDPLDRLNSADGSYGNLQFGYDAVGNRLQKILTQGSVTVTEDYNYAATSQQLDSIDIDNNGTNSTRLFDYDNAGNMIEDDNSGNVTAIQYNHANRPASALSAGNTIAYIHNSLGQRTVKNVNGAVQHFHYDEAGQLIAVSDGAGNVVEEFIYLGSMVVAYYYAANDEVYFAHNDHLNTVKALTDASGEIVWEVISQTPFGEVVTDEDPDGDSQNVVFNLRFPGQYFDGETQTSYNYFRTYDPSSGRYVQSDPIGLNGGLNTFAYVNSNPTNKIDPNGLDPLPPLAGQYLTHYFRNVNNKVPQNISAASDTPGWTQMSPAESVFHQQGPYGEGNTKWIDGTGRHEAVYNSDGELVTGRLNGGTFNFYSPRQNHGLDHVLHDVIPYLMWGNGPIIVDPPTFCW